MSLLLLELLPFLSFFLSTSTSSDSGSEELIAVGPVVAITFYLFIKIRYRNQDKRYKFEESDNVSATLTQKEDHFVKKVTKSKASATSGANNGNPTRRLRGNNSLKVNKKESLFQAKMREMGL